MNEEKIKKGFAVIVGLLTVSTLIYNYPAPSLAGLGLIGLGYFVYGKLNK